MTMPGRRRDARGVRTAVRVTGEVTVMPAWQVRTGNVRSIRVYDEGGGRAWVRIHGQDGRRLSWGVWAKTLCDLCHGAAVSVPELLDELRSALSPGRKSALTRWLNDQGGV